MHIASSNCPMQIGAMIQASGLPDVLLLAMVKLTAPGAPVYVPQGAGTRDAQEHQPNIASLSARLHSASNPGL
jgi:hypothetical protein